MTLAPAPDRRTRSVRVALAIALVALTGTAGTGVGGSAFADADDDRKIAICQATGSAKNPFVPALVSVNSIVKDKGHGGEDVIPIFTYLVKEKGEEKSETFRGLNLDKGGSELLVKGCKTAAELAEEQAADKAAADKAAADKAAADKAAADKAAADKAAADKLVVVPVVNPEKIWVCKFVGNPLEGFSLSKGKNPLHVSMNSTDADEAFSDQHPSFKVDSEESACRPDLAIVKTGPAEAESGASNNYTLTVTNNGARALTPVTVTDTLPPGVTAGAFPDAQKADWNCTTTGQQVSCAWLGGQKPFTAITIPVTFSAGPGPVVNSATVVVADDSDQSNNTSTFTTTVVAAPVASFSVVKTNNADGDEDYNAAEVATEAGADVPFQAVITNTGSTSITVSEITDQVGESAPTTVTCSPTLPDIAPGASATCNFVLEDYSPSDTLEKTNVVHVTAHPAGRPLLTTTNKSGSSIVTTMTPASFTVLKTNDAEGNGTYTEDETTTTVGKAVPFRVTVTNNGDRPLEVVEVLDKVDGGEAQEVACTFEESISPGSSAWCDFTLPAYSPADGQSKQNVVEVEAYELDEIIEVPLDEAVALVVAGESFMGFPVRLAEAAPVVDVVVPDTTTVTSNVAYVRTVVPTVVVAPPTLDPQIVDLAIQNVGPARTTAGSRITWDMTVTNVGNTAATQFTISNLLPQIADVAPNGLLAADTVGAAAGRPAVELRTISGARATCTKATVSCVYQSVLQPGASTLVTVTAWVPPTFRGTELVNTATVTPMDATPNNNASSVVTVIDPAAPGPEADLTLDKSGPTTAVAPGSVLTYALTVTNTSTVPAAGFTVEDQLPAGLTLEQATGPGFACTGQVRCTHAGELAPGASATVTVLARLAATYTGATVVNTATVLPVDGTDDNTDSVETPVSAVVVLPTEPIDRPTDGGSPGRPDRPSQLPFVADEPLETPSTATPLQNNRPRFLPFTGGSAEQQLALGATLVLLGLVLALATRRRRATES